MLGVYTSWSRVVSSISRALSQPHVTKQFSLLVVKVKEVDMFYYQRTFLVCSDPTLGL